VERYSILFARYALRPTPYVLRATRYAMLFALRALRNAYQLQPIKMDKNYAKKIKFVLDKFP